MRLPLPPISNVGRYDEHEPYYPFPVAVEKGILPNPEDLARPAQNPPGIDILWGRIPNYKNAGLLALGEKVVAAFDHTAAELHDDELTIMPAPKAAVSDTGHIQDEGLVVVGSNDGRLKIAALVLNYLEYPWLVENARARGKSVATIGDVAIMAAPVLDLPEFEMTDVDNKTGVITARPRQRIF